MNKVFFIPVSVFCVILWVSVWFICVAYLYVLSIKCVHVGMHTGIASQGTAAH